VIGGGCCWCRSGLGLAATVVVVVACIVWILFSSQLKRGPRPTASADDWSVEQAADDDDDDVRSSALVDLGGRPRRQCDSRRPRFAFCLSTTSASHSYNN